MYNQSVKGKGGYMQVNSVSSTNFGSTGKQKIDLETFANLSDRDLKNLAYARASYDVNDKKHKRINNAIFYSIPVVAGLGAAVNTVAPVVKNSKGAAKKLTGLLRTAKLKNFAKTTALWTSMFLAADAIFGAKHYLDKKSPTVKEFSEKHPVLSTFTAIGVGLAAVFGVSKGFPKFVKAFKSTQLGKDLLKKEGKLAAKLADNKLINKLSQKASKIPPAIKSFGKGLLNWGPLMLVLTSIMHTSSHERAKATEYGKNYETLKTAQSVVRETLDAASEIAEEV